MPLPHAFNDGQVIKSLRDLAAMESEDKLSHIVRCCAEKEYLRLFDLPRPYLDPLGRLAWDGNDDVLRKKYRKVGHPSQQYAQ